MENKSVDLKHERGDEKEKAGGRGGHGPTLSIETPRDSE